MVSSLYRRCWSSIASAISLSHSLPLLKDEIELCLLVYVLALATTHSIGFKVSLISCLGLHLLRGGYRWQLVPVYLSACVFFCVQGYVSAMRVMQIFCTLVSVALCYLIPSIPLINGKGKALGVQDLTFDGPSGKFWVRCFYPTKGTATNPEIAEFPVRSKINMKTIVSIATMVLSFSAIVYLEEGDSLPSLRLFSFFFFLHFCRLAYDSVYGLPSTAYIPGSEVVSVLDGVSDFAKLPSVMFSHMSHIRINCTQDAPVYNEAESTGGKLKVAFVLHGLGGTRCFYSFICMRLAAEGYFVICPEFGDGSACMSQLADGLKRGYENYKFEEGEIEASEGAFKWRHGQLEHRAEEMAIIVKHFASMSSVGPLQHSPAVRWQRRSGATTPSYFQHSLLPNLKGLKASDNSSGVQLDIRNPYIMGHSFGGATAIHVQRSSDKHATDFRSSIDR